MVKATKMQIFQGVTPKATRDYLHNTFSLLKGRYSKLVIPCAGRFSLPQIAVGAGWDAKNIIASDISLYSSIIGTHCMGKRVTDLGVEFTEDFEPFSKWRRRKSFGAATLLALKLAQFKSDNQYNQSFRDELWRNQDAYISEIHAQLDKFKERLDGMEYRIADIFAEMETFGEDPDAVLYLNPPGFKGGYGKMFDTAGRVSWNEPDIPEFDPSEGITPIFNWAKQAKCLALWYRMKEITAEEEPFLTFCDEQKIGEVDMTLANRPEEVPQVVTRRKTLKIKPYKAPMVPWDYEITEQSKVSVVKVTPDIALYYRDLLAHKLGATRSEAYFLILLDGYVFGTTAFFTNQATMRKETKLGINVFESYRFAKPMHYRRTGKLLMRILTSKAMQDALKKNIPALTYAPEFGFQTACIADVPETKGNRGILKLVHREVMPNGKYYLMFRSPFREETFADCVKWWIETQSQAKWEKK